MASNINADAFVPQVWDAAILRTLEDNLVAKKICTAKPAKQGKGYGDTVYFNGLMDPAVNSYSGSVSYEDLVSSQVALQIDQQNYYAFTVQDVEQAMANVDLKGSQASRAAYKLAQAVDQHIFGAATSPAYVDAGHTLSADADADTASILSDLSEMSRVLEENNVQPNDKWLVIPPWVKEKLILAGVVFEINEGINGKGGLAFTKYIDFDVFVSNNCYNSGTAAEPVSAVYAGSYNSIAYSDVLNESRAMQLEDKFEVGVSGLHVYGAKVIKPKELTKRVLTYNAESSI